MGRAEAVERRDVHFRGRVQGVGFRFTTVNIAAGFEVAGYVQNLADGSVLVVAEGKPIELDRFFAEIHAQMKQHIRDAASSTAPASGEFDSFDVRY